jgi:enoyl-CoA hydratase/carnithine racemase
MQFTEIEYGVTDNIATITLNRPHKLNAGTRTMVRELLDAFDRADSDDGVRAVILTGRGRAFCAGADLSAGAKTFDYDRTQPRPDANVTGRSDSAPRDGAGLITLRLFESTKPVISAINGPAVGMGVTITLATDVRLASDTARFGFVFARRGIVPDAASTWFLPRVVGVARAAELLYTGRIIDATEALNCHLVRSIHPATELLDAAQTLAQEIAEAAPVSVALTRRMLWRMLTADHPMAAHRADSHAIAVTGAQPDAREGVMSFLEKRPPVFTGRVSEDLPDVFPNWLQPVYE